MQFICLCTEAEFGELIVEHNALLRQVRSGGVHFLNHGGVLLRRLVHVIDGRIDLRQTCRLFLGCGGNGLHVLVRHADQCLDIAQSSSGIVDELYALIYGQGGRFYELLDLPCRCG